MRLPLLLVHLLLLLLLLLLDLLRRDLLRKIYLLCTYCVRTAPTVQPAAEEIRPQQQYDNAREGDRSQPDDGPCTGPVTSLLSTPAHCSLPLTI